MAEHPFNPIIDAERLEEAIEHVATTSLALARTVLQRELAVDTICFFAQGPEEYAYLVNAVQRRGTESRFSHAPTTYVDTDFTVAGQRIRIFGVREPDPAKPWVGYGDYPLVDAEYEALRDSDNPYIQEITSGRGQSLLQFEHPEFNVLGFAFQQQEHL